MSIPESQLETWSHQGATTTAKATHESIRNALAASASPVREKDYEAFLQGSYKNDTNIRGESDVDLVAQLNSTFQSDLSALTEPEKDLYRRSHPDATYLWADFRSDVLKALRAYYGSQAIAEGNKSIKIAAGTGRLASDAVVCLQYRKYRRFRGISDQEYVEGIVFFTLTEGRKVINFPKPHYENGVGKNSRQRTNGWYKPTVRVFKNARTYLVGHGVISSDLAPSYFLECLVYNVPDDVFRGSYQSTFYKALAFLSKADFSNFMCQNGQVRLFGDTPEQWSQPSARRLISALTTLWNDCRQSSASIRHGL